VGPCGAIDDGPAQPRLLEKRADQAIARCVALAPAKRPAEELYDVRKDPAQLVNLAGEPAYARTLARLRRELSAWQRATGDPRIEHDDDRWDGYPYYGAPADRDAPPR
jgi:N-sulfoglucosamine sulfohydrolase